MHWTELRYNSPKELLNKVNIIEPAIDVHAICETLGVKVIIFNDEDRIWSGALTCEDDNPVIWVRATKDKVVHQRFTIAHELGHLLLHLKIFSSKGKCLHRDVTYSGTRYESEANSFATNLLMPKEMLRWRALKTMNMQKKERYKYLAAIFDVSEKAIEYRLWDMGLFSY